MVKVDYSSLQTMSQSTETSCNDLNTKIQQIMNPLNSIMSDGEISGAGPDAIKAFAASTVGPMLLAQGRVVMETASAVKDLESKYSGNVDSKSWEDTEIQEIIDKLQTQIDKIEEKLKKKKPKNKSGLKRTLESLKKKKKFYEKLLQCFRDFCNDPFQEISVVSAIAGLSSVISGYKGGSGKNSFKDDPGQWALDTLKEFSNLGSNVGTWLDIIEDSARWQMFCKVMPRSEYYKWMDDYVLCKWKEFKGNVGKIVKLPKGIKDIINDSNLTPFQKLKKCTQLSKYDKKYEKYIDYFEHKNDKKIEHLKEEIDKETNFNKEREERIKDYTKKKERATKKGNKKKYQNRIDRNKEKIDKSNEKIKKHQETISKKSKKRKNIHKKVDKLMKSKPMKVVKSVGTGMSIIDTLFSVNDEKKEGDSTLKAVGDVAVAKVAGFAAGKVAGAICGAIPVVGPVTGVLADAAVSSFVESKVEENI